LPMGTRVRVTNRQNGKSVIVRINDRGPYIKRRIIDVTKGVARKLDFVKKGVVPVIVEVLD
ncbi:MAG: septal ring lytic transglycosylase RlpA family protein, partial [Akkermansiaceae bacterium]|nr:septal ring lytic transglycosylase RlpA family protein [Akkermansiaceae bacterium]